MNIIFIRNLYFICIILIPSLSLAESAGMIISAGDPTVEDGDCDLKPAIYSILSKGVVGSVFIPRRGFIVAHSDGYILSSSDGESWRVLTDVLIPNKSMESLYSLAWDGESLFLSTFGGKIYRSDDGIQWVRVYSSSKDIYAPNIYANNNAIIFEERDSSGVRYLYSKDKGVTWEYSLGNRIPENGRLSEDSDKFYYVTRDGEIWVSSDGTGWDHIESIGSDSLGSIIVKKDISILVGNGIKISLDMNSWKSKDIPYKSQRYLYDGLLNKNGFIVYGGCGVLLHSLNGVVWERVRTNVFTEFMAIASDGKRTIVVGKGGSNGHGLVMFSVDDKNWNDVTTEINKAITTYLGR